MSYLLNKDQEYLQQHLSQLTTDMRNPSSYGYSRGVQDACLDLLQDVTLAATDYAETAVQHCAGLYYEYNFKEYGLINNNQLKTALQEGWQRGYQRTISAIREMVLTLPLGYSNLKRRKRREKVKMSINITAVSLENILANIKSKPSMRGIRVRSYGTTLTEKEDKGVNGWIPLPAEGEVNTVIELHNWIRDNDPQQWLKFLPVFDYSPYVLPQIVPLTELFVSDQVLTFSQSSIKEEQMSQTEFHSNRWYLQGLARGRDAASWLISYNKLPSDLSSFTNHLRQVLVTWQPQSQYDASEQQLCKSAFLVAYANGFLQLVAEKEGIDRAQSIRPILLNK